MGALMSALGRGKVRDVFIDLETAQPTANEQELFDEVAELLTEGAARLESFGTYGHGRLDLIRTAMSSPSPENERNAFEALFGVIGEIRSCYALTQRVQRVAPKLVVRLACAPDGEEAAGLGGQQALARQLCELLELVLRFDKVRMETPEVPNDFSFFKRMWPRCAKDFPEDCPVPHGEDMEMSNLAMWCAQHIPMMDALRLSVSSTARQGYVTVYAEDGTPDLGQRQPANLDMPRQISTALACLANSCLKMLEENSFASDESASLGMHAMTGAIVLYDHVEPLGVFRAQSGVQTKRAVAQLKAREKRPLLNAVQFCTAHFSDASTPKGIRELFD